MSKRQQWSNICNRVDTCALTGAAAFVAGIPQSEVLINGPLWCYFYALRYLERADYTTSLRIRGSQPDNNAVVYGAEKYIMQALQNLMAEGQKPSVLLLESSCAMSLIGDDLKGIVRKEDLPFPVITMDCGGMLGGFAEGYTRAAQAAFELLLPKQAGERRPLAVNLIGQTDFYLQGAADTEELQRLLVLAGYEVLTAPGSGSSVEALQHIPEAALNIVTNIELGLAPAQYLEKKYGTPYIIVGLPYGIEGTLRWLEKLNEVLPCPYFAKLQAEAEALQQLANAKNSEARLLWGALWFDEVLVSAPPTQALCLAQSLRTEWADMGRLTVICQQSLPQLPECEAADAVYAVGQDDEAIEQYLNTCNNVLVLASSSESSVLYRRNECSFIPCNIAYPAQDDIFFSRTPFVGFRGCLQLQERLWNKFSADLLQKRVR